MYWNYRLLRTQVDGEGSLAIVEVYYNDDGTLQGYTGPATVEGFDGATADAMQAVLQQMLAAVEKPILTPADFTLPK